MQNEFTVLWIDDDKQRRESGRGGVGNTDQINIKPIGPMEVASELLSQSNEETKVPSEPDLALVDWYLHTDDYAGDGPSIEGILRDRFPNTPIYGFSGEYGNAQFNREQKRGESRFALITSPDRLNDSKLIKDMKDYQRICGAQGKGIDGILELLDAPSELRAKVQSTLPQEFAEGLPSKNEGDSGSTLRFARWVRHELLEQAGLLWDSVWTATNVGISKERFSEYKPSLSQAKYTGIFSHRNDRWWRIRVRDLVFKLADQHDSAIDRIWNDGPELLGVAEEDIATCEVGTCEKTHQPQTVAAGSPSEKPAFQVHYNCSNIEQSRGSTYEDLRVLVEL